MCKIFQVHLNQHGGEVKEAFELDSFLNIVSL